MQLFNLTLKSNASSGENVTVNEQLSLTAKQALSGSILNGKSISNHVSTLCLSVLPLNRVILLGSAK